MKIAIIAPYDILALDNGAAVRVYELARNLNANGASVSVMHHGKAKSFNSKLTFVHFTALSLLPGSSNYLHPLNVTYYLALIRFLKDFKPDIIQCEQPWSAWATFFFARIFNIPCILDEHNVEYMWGLSASRLPFLAPINFALERTACSNSSYILTTSEIDKKILIQMYKTSENKVFVVPNGVNTQRFTAILDNQSKLKRKLGLSSAGKAILFHGVMSAKQNFGAAKIIAEFLAPKFRGSNVLFLIIGKNPPEWLKNKGRKEKDIMILEYVKNIEEYIIAADVCIAPIQSGSGTRLKVLEYLAAGKPIIATYKAVEGLEVINGIHCILNNDVDEAFIDSINKVINNEKLQSDLSSNALILSKDYDWYTISSSLFSKYEQFLGS